MGYFVMYYLFVSSLILLLSNITIAQNAQSFYKGHDLSSLKLLEDGGAIYKDTAQDSVTRPAEDILKDGGMNTVRLRCVSSFLF